MKLVIDINLSPDWVHVFLRHKIEAVHWSSVGDPCAEDQEIMKWALNNNYIVVTH